MLLANENIPLKSIYPVIRKSRLWQHIKEELVNV